METLISESFDSSTAAEAATAGDGETTDADNCDRRSETFLFLSIMT